MEGSSGLPIRQHRTGKRTGNLFEEIIPFVCTVKKIPDDLFAQSVIQPTCQRVRRDGRHALRAAHRPRSKEPPGSHLGGIKGENKMSKVYYKGFNKDMTCRGFQFKEGETYEEQKAELCKSGFHACERPLDVFNYYAPGQSVFHEVELDDVSSERETGDSKVCAKKIKVGAKLDVRGLVKAQIEYVKAHTTTEHTDPERATAGNYGAAASRGRTSVGKNGVGLARGNGVKARGGIGAVLLIAEEEDDSSDVKEWRAFVVDGETIKADTWYQLKDGELVETEE